MKRMTIVAVCLVAAACGGSSPSPTTPTRAVQASAGFGTFAVGNSALASSAVDFAACLASPSAACFFPTRMSALAVGGTPTAPTNVVATAVGGTVTISWTGQGIDPVLNLPVSYVIEAGSTPGAADLASVPTVVPPFVARGVGAGTYYVRVRAKDIISGAMSAPSNEAVLVVGGGPCAAPGAPSALTMVSNSGGTLVLSWAAAPGSPTSYIVEAGSSSGLSNLANSDLGLTTTLTANGVGAGTYFVRIRAKNACGTSGLSNEVQFTVGTTTPGFTGTTLVTPGISYRANRSQPPFNISAAQSATVQVTFTAPADCSVTLADCPADGKDLANCVPRRSVLGSAGSANWTASYQPGAYQVVISLQTLPRSANGPVCQAFSGTIPFSGTVTLR